ncbi:unnamed protein product [Calicophoron daubneyi]
MMNLEGIKPEVDSKNRIIPLTNYGIKCMSMGFLVDPGSAVVWRGLMVMSAIQQLLRQVIWGPMHTLVVDMPPGTGDVQLSLCQNVPISGAVIVTSPQAVAVSDTQRGIQMLNKLKVPIYGLLENMSEFICPNCGHRSPMHANEDQDKDQEGNLSGGIKLARTAGLELLGRIPFDPRLIGCCDSGRPFFATFPQSELAQIYRGLATRILQFQARRSDRDSQNTN